MIGTLLGNRYELLEKIGEGGMAVVYKAKCHLLDRYVAVKVLKEQYTNDSDFVEKFKNEATAAASLSHNNIVNVYDVGSENSINYIVMEYVNGKTLKKIITEDIRLSFPKAINIAIQIASGLECAHKNNLIHRDIKPHNILVTEDGIAKVADFGIAKVANSMTITNSNEIIGSAHYFSPEQAKGGFVDCTTDIYSLGIVMYEMVTGKVPYDADSAVSIAIKHIQEPVVPPKQIISDIPESLNRLILKAMEKEPIKRYQSAKEMLIDLNRIKENSNSQIKLSNLEDDFTRVMAPVTLNDINNNNKEQDQDLDYKKSMKRSTKVILAALAVIVALVVGVSAGKLVAMFNKTGASSLTTGNLVKVPELLGRPSADAQKTVVDLGLKFQVVETEVSDQPSGTVTQSNVKAGDEVSKGSEVRVKISGGKEVIKLRDLTTEPESTAKDAIVSDGFVVGHVTQDYSDTVSQGLVLSQVPDADTPYEKGGKVDIVISKGPKIVTVPVPDLKGKTLEEAKTILQDKGLKLGATTALVPPNDNNAKNNDGKIYLQSKVSGSSADKGSTIDVTYYKLTNDQG